MKYIYESPDGGKTVYRHPLGHPDKRELVGGQETVVVEGLVVTYSTTGDPGIDSSARE